MWVIQEAYDRGDYKKLFTLVKEWTENFWPFKNVFYSNKEMPS